MHSVSSTTKTINPEHMQDAQADAWTDVRTATRYGYLQADAVGDDLENLLNTLREMGIAEDCIYRDTAATGEEGRPEYDQMVQRLRRGDTLVIASLDMLGGTYAEIMEQWKMLTNGIRIKVVVLDIPTLDMRRCHGREQCEGISNLTLQFLTFAAKRENEELQRRQREGIMAAKARGVRFGRPPKPIPPQFDEILVQWRNREISSRRAAQKLNVAQETFLRWARRS